jgi:hypothetical protein
MHKSPLHESPDESARDSKPDVADVIGAAPELVSSGIPTTVGGPFSAEDVAAFDEWAATEEFE